MSTELTLYSELLTDIKSRVRQAQTKAALSANAEMILMKNELPEQKGFSARNIGYMIRFAREYAAPPILQPPAAKLAEHQTASSHAKILPPAVAKLLDAKTQASGSSTVPLAVAQLGEPKSQTPASAILPQPAANLGRTDERAAGSSILQPPVAKLETQANPALAANDILRISWSHNIILMEKLKDLPTRVWYARQTAAQGWSRDTLAAQIKSRLHERQGTAVSNFSRTLPEVHASLAQGLLKDPFIFDFLTLEEPFHERELEVGLLSHIEKFLLELGRGFAFVGRQYPLTVSDREFSLDLLFYHLHLRCFVVVDLKLGEFLPEHAGKMNFYCSVVDDQLRHQHDAPTLGLILCQSKDRIIAEYALRDVHKPIGIADYEFTRTLPAELASSLPSIEAIEAELSRSLEEINES